MAGDLNKRSPTEQEVGWPLRWAFLAGAIALLWPLTNILDAFLRMPDFGGFMMLSLFSAMPTALIYMALPYRMQRKHQKHVMGLAFLLNLVAAASHIIR